MRSQNNYRNNRNRNDYSAQSDAGRNYRDNSDYYGYNSYDRDHNDEARDYNSYDRSDTGRYANYEGNYGRGNNENSYSSPRYNSRNNYNNNDRYATGSHSGTWENQEPRYYGRYADDERSYSEYGGTRRRDEKDWTGGDGRNYASDYDNDGRYSHHDDRGFFGRVGDRIRDTWHDLTDRDDMRENMRRFKEGGGYNTYGSYSDDNRYNNRGNYRPYPEGRSDDSYGSSTRARNNNRGAYAERGNEYGAQRPDRYDEWEYNRRRPHTRERRY